MTRYKPLVLAALALLAGYLIQRPAQQTSVRADAPAQIESEALTRAYDARQSNVWVSSSGTVAKLLPDDEKGSRHQRFIVELASGQTVLIAHNIDLAPRVPLSTGDRVEFHGEYEWNEKGGAVHWTHHDPQGARDGGWIRWQGQTFR